MMLEDNLMECTKDSSDKTNNIDESETSANI